MAPGTAINSANLTLTVNLETLGGGNAEMVVHGYLANDAVITLDDFEVTNPVSGLTLWPGNGGVGSTRTYNIPYWFQTAARRLEPAHRPHRRDEHLRHEPALQRSDSAQLTIDYTPPVGTPPELTFSRRTTTSRSVQGTTITFQGTPSTRRTATAVGASLASNIDGYFGMAAVPA